MPTSLLIITKFLSFLKFPLSPKDQNFLNFITNKDFFSQKLYFLLITWFRNARDWRMNCPFFFFPGITPLFFVQEVKKVFHISWLRLCEKFILVAGLIRLTSVERYCWLIRGCRLPRTQQLMSICLATWNSLSPVENPASTSHYRENVTGPGGLTLSKSCL